MELFPGLKGKDHVTWLMLFSLVILSSALEKKGENVIIDVLKGKLRGNISTSRGGKEYFSFLGVPYGSAPERFQLGQLHTGWDGIRNATEFAPRCAQQDFVNKEFYGVEDCLTMDIYTPKIDGKMTVMVFIHGGGFQAGSGRYFTAKYLMDEDVVFVSLQYRMGALGFFNTGDDTVTANNGLKDQNLALQWIQKNIHHFGGDKNNVHLFGLSAGGASTHYHVLSPMSKGLFHSALAMSGSALNPWAYQRHPADRAKQLAEFAGCPTQNNKEMVDCLKSLPLQEFGQAQNKFKKYGDEFDLITMLFTPSMEPENAEPKMVVDNPWNLVQSGVIANKVPFAIGTTDNEGSFYNALLMNNEEALQTINKDWMKMFPNMFYYEESLSPKKQEKITKKVHKFYLKGKNISEETRNDFASIFSDRFFVHGVAKAAQLHANAGHPVYLYYFDYATTFPLIKTYFGDPGVKFYGNGHVDDLQYIFDRVRGAPEYDLGTKHGDFSHKYTNMWTTFAKTGNIQLSSFGKNWTVLKPTRKIDALQFFAINDTPQMIPNPFGNRLNFWEKLNIYKDIKTVSKDEL